MGAMSRDLRIASLDGLRGIAASAVVYAHINFFYPSTNPWINLATGDEAVAIFFSLSGFLMALLYGGRPMQAADYLVHRFARIYPVYLVSVLFVAALSVIYPDYVYPIHGAVQLLRHVALIGSTGVYWSIPPEIQFYLFFLLIWLWFLDPRKYQLVAVGTAVFLIVAAYFDFPGPGILLTSKLPYFLFGALAGRLYAIQKTQPDGPASGVAVLALLAFFIIARGFWPLNGSFWGISSALTATVIVYLAACNNRLSAAVLGARPLAFAGKISFSLYLFHLPVMFIGMKIFHFLPAEAALVLSIAMAYLFAWASFTSIEDPARKLLTGLWRDRRPKVPVAAE
jgi:peptidoglycan/LPS O-acetylase OafA/YrhL